MGMIKKELKDVEVNYSKRTELNYWQSFGINKVGNAIPIISKLGITDFINVADKSIEIDTKKLDTLSGKIKSLQGNDRRILSNAVKVLKNIFSVSVAINKTFKI